MGTGIEIDEETTMCCPQGARVAWRGTDERPAGSTSTRHVVSSLAFKITTIGVVTTKAPTLSLLPEASLGSAGGVRVHLPNSDGAVLRSRCNSVAAAVPAYRGDVAHGAGEGL